MSKPKYKLAFLIIYISSIIFLRNIALSNNLNNYFKLDTIYLLNERFTDNSKIIPKIFKDKIFCIYNDIFVQNDSSFIYISDVKTNLLYKLFIPGSITNKFNVRDFVYYGNYLYILFFKGLIKFKLKDSIFFYDSITYLDEPFCNLKIENNKLYYYDIGKFYDNRLLFNGFNKFMIYNITKDSIEDSLTYSIPYNYYFTLFQPKELSDFLNNKLLFSEITKYELKVMNINNNQIDTIKRMPEKWKLINDSDRNIALSNALSNNNNLKDLIDIIRPLNKKVSLIHNTLFINDTTIIILWSQPDEINVYSYFIDIWQYKNKKWISKCFNIKNNKSQIDNNLLFSQVMLIPNTFSISGDKIIFIEPLPFNIYKNNLFNEKFVDVKKAVDDYYKTHDLRYSLFIVSLKKI